VIFTQEKSEKGVKFFRPVQKTSVVNDIIEQIKGLIRDNRFGPGSKLPSERELAKQLGVSRPSLREALRTLALMGVLDTRHGAGNQIADSGANVLRTPFEFLIVFEQPSVRDLYEARELIEVFLAGRAAERRTAEELAAIEAALADMRKVLTDPDPSAWTEPNLRFHAAIWKAAHHPVLEHVLSCLRQGIHLCIETSRRAFQSLVVPYEIHAKIAEAIRRQQSETARRAMSQHMKLAREALQKLEENSSK
jgi:GntR family transcriptional repressor for pyruvate dehydrogenase complex